jgi:hypothetical protein
LSSVGSSWSRRRVAVAAEAAAGEVAAQDAILQAEQDVLAEKSDADILEELGLPDPDSLEMGDDFKVFLSKTVPNHIRKRALRTLWRSNPVLACVDGLNDYDDDYLTQGLNQGVIKTSYQVGKGMLAHLLEVERQKEAFVEEDADEIEEIEEIAPEIVAETLVMAEVEVPVADEEPVILAPRRMQFQFQEDSV